MHLLCWLLMSRHEFSQLFLALLNTFLGTRHNFEGQFTSEKMAIELEKRNQMQILRMVLLPVIVSRVFTFFGNFFNDFRHISISICHLAHETNRILNRQFAILDLNRKKCQQIEINESDSFLLTKPTCSIRHACKHFPALVDGLRCCAKSLISFSVTCSCVSHRRIISSAFRASADCG